MHFIYIPTALLPGSYVEDLVVPFLHRKFDEQITIYFKYQISIEDKDPVRPCYHAIAFLYLCLNPVRPRCT